jgi:Mg2+ and Co2+ transporter CorA
LKAVALGWRTNGWETAGDLGLAVLTELAATYTSAGRTLFAWHEAWELDFYRRKHATEIETLHDLRQLGARFRVQLEALNQPGMSRDPRLVWFSHVSEDSAAERADDLIDRALANLRSFSEVLRTSTDLVATMSFSEQSRRSEQFQEFATLVAAVLLVPTLVAGIYGANTRLPGEHDWSGFVVMLLAMVISAVATFGFIRVWRRRGRTDD